MERLDPNGYVRRNMRRLLYRLANPPVPLRRDRLMRLRGTRHKYAHLYNTAAWQTLRGELLLDTPLCRKCGAVATEADHVRPHNGDKELFFDRGNLQALCKECHKKKTRKGL